MTHILALAHAVTPWWLLLPAVNVLQLAGVIELSPTVLAAVNLVLALVFAPAYTLQAVEQAVEEHAAHTGR